MELKWGSEFIEDYLCKIIDSMNLDTEEKDLLKENIRQNGIAYVMRTLTPREQSVLVKRADGKTLREIGKEFVVTLERVRQIEQKMRRRVSMRLTTLLSHIKEEKRQYYALCEEEQKLVKALKDRIPQLQSLIEFLDRLEPISEEKSETEIPMVINEDIKSLDTRIDKIGLSVRSYNALVRYMSCSSNDYGRNVTLRELSELTKLDLMKIRNLGRKSYNEIISVLESYGIELKEGTEIEY